MQRSKGIHLENRRRVRIGSRPPGAIQLVVTLVRGRTLKLNPIREPVRLGRGAVTMAVTTPFQVTPVTTRRWTTMPVTGRRNSDRGALNSILTYRKSI
jgi:hypothetical protein